MCLIIFRQKDQNLTKEFFLDVASRNSDGWGIMWVSGKGDKRRVKTASGMEFNKFWAAYTSLQANNVQCLIHFRYTTHGETSLSMCHPFEVAEGVYMMHNGMVDVKGIDYDEKTKSDTWAFAELVVRPMLANRTEPLTELIRSDWFKFTILKLIGTGNRMVFLDKDGPVAIDTKNWSKTTEGVVVSNSYAYTVNNPTYKPVASRLTAYNYDMYEDYDYNGGGYYKGGIWYPASTSRHYTGYNNGNTALNTQPTTAVATVPAVTSEVVKETVVERKEEAQSKLIHMFSRKAEEAKESDVEAIDDYDSDQKKEFDLTEQYEDIIRFITLDSDYAEEIVYQDPNTAIEVLKYLAEDY